MKFFFAYNSVYFNLTLGEFASTLIKSGSIYEGVKVHQPDEFDFIVRIDCLTNKLGLSRCENNPGYVNLQMNKASSALISYAATSKGWSTNLAVP